MAVGTQYPSGYEGELDPQGGRVWTSVDGRQWNDLTPDHAFDGVDLTHIYEAADGSLILLGLTNQETETRYWRSTDTRNWQELKDLGLPSGLLVLYAEHGSRGYLIAGGESGVGWTLWFSTDGLSWDRVWTEPDDRATREFIHGIAAGNAGFAAKGVAVANMVGEWFLLTSPDGREWAAPPEARDWGGFKLTSHNGGWVAVATHEFYGGPYVPPAPARPTVWISADGVSWTDVLELTVQPPTLDGDPRCRTGVPELTSAGPWIVMSTGFSCWYGGEGLSPVVEAYGTPRISTDGVHWQPLPFSEFSYDPVAHEAIDAGSIIRVAVAIDGDLLLGGESNGKVTFWLGEAP